MAEIGVVIVFTIIAIIIFISSIYLDRRRYHNEYLKERSSFIRMKISNSEKKGMIYDIDIEKKKLEYSKSLIEYIKEYSAQIVVIKFKTFVDTHDMKNSTRQQFENLIKEIATEVKASINFEGKTIFTDRAIDKFIVDNVIMYVKDLLDKNDNYEIPFDM